MAVKTGGKRKTKAKTVFVLTVLLLAAAFMVYYGLFTKPREKLVQKVVYIMQAAEATPAPSPTPQPTPDLHLPDIDLTSWEYQIANDAHRLPEDFAPPELTEIEAERSVDSRIAEPLRQLLADARAAGYTDIYLCSGYRSYDTQYQIYWNHIWDYMNQGVGQDEAMAMTKKAVNAPGSSEHQLGLSVDILESYTQDMEPYIGGSGLMLWFEQHCTEYGFIIRYPEDKTGITGVEYEPWHLRYVGKTAAEYIMQHGICLEEFLTYYGSYDN